MTASASPAAGAATAALAGQPASAPLTRVALAYIEPRFKLYLRFGEPARTHQLDRWRRCAVFLPGAMLCRIRWQANDYGTVRWQLMVMQACTPLDAAQRIPGVQPGRACCSTPKGRTRCARCWSASTPSSAGHRARRCLARVLAHARQPARCTPAAARIHRRAARCLANREDAAMTLPSAVASATGIPPHPRSRLRARLVLAGLSACGLAALAWASFVHPLPRLIYNPSDSVAVGWYRVDPQGHGTGSLPRPLSVGSIVPDHAAARRRAGRAAATCRRACRCSARGRRRAAGVVQHWPRRPHRRRAFGRRAACRPLGRPLPSWQQCRRLESGELFLLSVTNPASFDSRYFGPVSASAVIGVAHPVWLESRP